MVTMTVQTPRNPGDEVKVSEADAVSTIKPCGHVQTELLMFPSSPSYPLMLVNYTPESLQSFVERT